MPECKVGEKPTFLLMDMLSYYSTKSPKNIPLAKKVEVKIPPIKNEGD
jgi:hypothetical protein